MRILGMISGTSHDGIDVAVVDFTLREHPQAEHGAALPGAALPGSALHGTVLHERSVPYPPALRSRIIAALPPAPTTLAEVCELDTLIGQAFAQVAADVAADVDGIDAICSHGQTVYHWVEGGHARGTLQIGQPAWIAEQTGIPVVSDVRIRDITAGGHGAPLVSFLDELLLAGRPERSAALNLGGIANMTVLDHAGLYAYDIGPANALIDAVVVDENLHPEGFDADGRIARNGTVNETLLRHLLADPFYALPAPKSTGKEHFHLGYVRAAEQALGMHLEPADLVRTLAELTVRTVAAEVRRAGIHYLAISGGGCRNPVLVDGLVAALPNTRIVQSDELGASADSKEAIAFALIGWCTMHGVPGTTPGGTGARAPRVLGTVTPGAAALRLPEPVTVPLHSLTLGT